VEVVLGGIAVPKQDGVTMTSLNLQQINALAINEGDPNWRITIVHGVAVWVDANGEIKGRAVSTGNRQRQLLEAYLERMRERQAEDEAEEEIEIREAIRQYFVTLEVHLNGTHRLDAVITTGDEPVVEITGINNKAPDPLITVSSVQVRNI
jgi:hypothetical protein